MKTYKIAVLPGDGIGTEVMEQALLVLEAVAKRFDFKLETTEALVGGAALDAKGVALPAETVAVCEASQAILFGSVGGPKWENLPPQEQPERASLLPLRKHFGLYANLRPAVLYEELAAASPLKNDRLRGGLDLLIVRELTGGIYFSDAAKGEKGHDDTQGFDTMRYRRREVERIAKVAFKAARQRKKKVTSIDKANVLSSMVFWRQVVSEVGQQFPEVALSHMYVDNAAMQLVQRPQQFDVLLCGNMFGDILSDEAAMITGSLGMLPSASLSDGGFGLYEPIGGSAPDIAGQNKANPIAQLLSAALLLEHSLGELQAAKAIRKAVGDTLKAGYRTADIFRSEKEAPEELVTTTQMGQLVRDAL